MSFFKISMSAQVRADWWDPMTSHAMAKVVTRHMDSGKHLDGLPFPYFAAALCRREGSLKVHLSQVLLSPLLSQ